jgi:dTDP-4-amino-4,6-dideoxy-D-galactose acyltransferase
VLILKKKGLQASLKDHVYGEMADFFKVQFPKAEVYEFTDNSALIKKIKIGNHKRVIIPSTTSKELCLTLSENKVVQILIGSNNDLIDIVDIIIDPLEELDLKYFYGIKFLPKVLLLGQYADDIASYLQFPLSKLKSELEHNPAEEILFEIVSLIYAMNWDSGFFKSNIAFLSSVCLTKNIENYVQNFSESNDINLIQFRCNCHDRETVRIAENNKYLFVDIRLTMEKSINDTFIPVDKRKGIDFRKAVKADIEGLVECGKSLYYDSRYYYDKNFDNKKVDEFYSGWIKKAVLGLFDDFCYALYENNKPIGFCTIKLKNRYSASIGLLGIHQNYINEGLGQYMLNMVIGELYKDGITYIDVVTQGRNYSAQRLYQRCGFLTLSNELWYHKWLSKVN